MVPNQNLARWRLTLVVPRWLPTKPLAPSRHPPISQDLLLGPSDMLAPSIVTQASGILFPRSPGHLEQSLVDNVQGEERPAITRLRMILVLPSVLTSTPPVNNVQKQAERLDVWQGAPICTAPHCHVRPQTCLLVSIHHHPFLLTRGLLFLCLLLPPYFTGAHLPSVRQQPITISPSMFYIKRIVPSRTSPPPCWHHLNCRTGRAQVCVQLTVCPTQPTP